MSAKSTAAAIITANFLQSISVGINAIILTTALSSYGASTFLIGLILGIEYLSVFAISGYLPQFLKVVSLKTGLNASLLFRLPPLLLLGFFVEPSMWALLIFIHGIGNFMFGILLQTWINSLDHGNNQGWVMGLFGTSISLGLALGPLLLTLFEQNPAWLATPLAQVEALVATHLGLSAPTQVSSITKIGLLLSAVLSALCVLPTLFAKSALASDDDQRISTKRMIASSPAAFFAVMLCGFTILGLQSFVTLYGIKNGLSMTHATYLVTAFMLGSITLEAPIAALSDRFDRRYVLIVLVLLGMLCSIYLPIAIYWSWIAWGLLFLWGGIMGSIFSICLALMSERYHGGVLVSANATFSIMDNLGGLVGVIVMGTAMHFFGEDGFPYALMLASAIYFAFALTRYRIQ